MARIAEEPADPSHELKRDERQGPLVLGMSLGQAAKPAVAAGSAAAAAAVSAEEGQEEGAAAGSSGPALTAKHPRPSRPVQPAAVFGDDDDGELKVVDWMDIAVREPDTPSLPLLQCVSLIHLVYPYCSA